MSTSLVYSDLSTPIPSRIIIISHPPAFVESSPTVSAVLEIAKRLNTELTSQRYHYHATTEAIEAAIKNHKAMKHFVEEYYDHRFALSEKKLWLIRRRCLTDPGLQRTWILKENVSFTEERGL